MNMKKMDIFDQFKEKLQSVQQDLSDGFKTLSLKAREVSRQRSATGDLHYQYPDGTLSRPFKVDAGAELLNKFHKSWGEIHREIESSAEKGVVIDNKVQDVYLKYERRAEPLVQFQRQVQDLPKMVEQIQNITVTISKIEADFEELESMMIAYEDMCDKMDLQRNKKTQLEELTKYKEQRRKEEELKKANFQEEYNQKFNEIEKKEDAKLKERQKAFEDVFSADMDHYRQHGKIESPIAEIEPCGKSISSLEEFDLSVEMGDQQALDDFLDTVEDVSVTKEDESVTETEVVKEEEEVAEEKEEERTSSLDDGGAKAKVRLGVPGEENGERRTSSVLSDDSSTGRRTNSVLSDESSAGDESGIMGLDYEPEYTGPIEVQSDAEDIDEEDFATPEAVTPEAASDSDEDTEEESAGEITMGAKSEEPKT